MRMHWKGTARQCTRLIMESSFSSLVILKNENLILKFSNNTRLIIPFIQEDFKMENPVKN